MGCFEIVRFPELADIKMVAKIDTGAYSGALNCESIKVIKRNGKRTLSFKPSGGDLIIEKSNFTQTYVRSALGQRQRRYIITTIISIGGSTYPITIGLSDRTKMKKPVLIGRRFIRENNILVDVRINQEMDDEWSNIT